MQTKEHTVKKSEMISFCMLPIWRSSVLVSCGSGILVLSPLKRISEIIVYRVARRSAAEIALLAQYELAWFLSYNKATASHYAKITLLLRFFCKTVVGHCYGKKGSEESHRRIWREGIWSEHKKRKPKWMKLERSSNKNKVRGKGK